MTEKLFKIVNDCGDYHLMNGDERLGYDLCSPAMRKANWNNVVDKLNEQEEEIQRLKKELKNRKKMNNILEGFLLDKGYDFNDILKFLQDRTEKGEGE